MAYRQSTVVERLYGNHTGNCTIWIDRHTHKTAGTTLREAMIKLQSYGFLQLAGGWHLEWRSLENFFAAVRAIRAPCEFPSRVLIAIEAHDGTMTDFATVDANHSSAARRRGRVLSRLADYACARASRMVSAWRWAGEPRLGQATKRGIGRSRAGRHRTCSRC